MSEKKINKIDIAKDKVKQVYDKNFLMCPIEEIRGTEFCDARGLVDEKMMELLGFEVIQIKGRKSGGSKTYMLIFRKEGLPYVYVECYFGKVELYSKFIIDTELFDKLDIRNNKALVLNTCKGDGKRAVLSISIDGTIKSLHRLFYILVLQQDIGGFIVDHISRSYNIIIPDNLRLCDAMMNAKNRITSTPVDETKEGFRLTISENPKILSDVKKAELKAEGFQIKENNRKTVIIKVFPNKLEAIRALRNYEEKYYVEHAYSPMNDLRGRFDLKFEQLILENKLITQEYIERDILEEYKNDAVKIARYGLEKYYKKYDMWYNAGKTLANGDFIA